MSPRCRWAGPKAKRPPTRRPFPRLEALEDRLAPATLTVNTTADTVSGTVATLDLREAILLINSAGTATDDQGNSLGAAKESQIDTTNPYGTSDTINFCIPGSGVQTISLTAALPTITRSVDVNGFSQPGSSPNTLPVMGPGAGDNAVRLITLDGTQLGGTLYLGSFTTLDGINAAFDAAGPSGLVIAAGNSTVAGLVIQNFGVPSFAYFRGNEFDGVSGAGIRLTSSGNTVAGNYVTNTATAGVQVLNSENNTIGGNTPGARNLFASNQENDVEISGPDVAATDNQVQGNYIGTDGTQVLGGGIGVYIADGGSDNVVADNLIASQNSAIAIGGSVSSPATGNLVQDNYVGTNAAGNAVLPGLGIEGVIFGGTQTQNTVAHNVVSGWGRIQVDLAYNGVFGFEGNVGNVVEGNYIGTNAAGSAALPSDNPIGSTLNRDGIRAAYDSTISGNLISGVGTAIVTAPGCQVLGNLIGTDASGTQPIPNGVGIVVRGSNIVQGDLIENNGLGVEMSVDSRLPSINSLIGGLGPGEGNVIAFNDGPAVEDVGTADQTGNQIEGNSIYSNAGPGVWVQSDPFGSADPFGAFSDGLATGLRIQGNSIYGNGGLGITLGTIAVDATGNPLTLQQVTDNFQSNPGLWDHDEPSTAVVLNDSLGHIGANNFQDFPVLTAAESGSSLLVSGSLTSAANTTYTVDVYASPTVVGADLFQGQYYGQGQYYLGTTSVTTDDTGNISFAADFSAADLPNGVVPAGWYISATATDQSGNTSEFSADVQAADSAPSFVQAITQSLQTAINASSTPTVTLQLTPATAAAVASAIAGVSVPQNTTASFYLILAPGNYNPTTVQVPAGMTLYINGTPGTVIDPATPAFTLTGGKVVISNVTFVTTGDAPTILVTGGNLTLRNDVVQGTTGFSDPVILVTAGTLDLGTPTSPGGNTIAVNGTGTLLSSPPGALLSAVGDTFLNNGVVVNPFDVTSGTASANPAAFGQPVTFTATVTPSAQGATPTGSVDFFDATTQTDLGSASLSTAGTAQLTPLVPLPVGTQTIILSYGGSASLLPGSTTLTVTVQPSVYVLNSTAAGALSVSGNASIQVAGLVVVDSSSTSALTASGNATVRAASIQVAGGVQKTANATLSPAPHTGSSAVPDPLARLPIPCVSFSGTPPSVSLSGSSSRMISPGVYSQISVSGNASLTLLPGVYVLDGGNFSVTGNATVSGSCVLLYFAGSNYPTAGGSFGSIALSGNGSINLTAAATGTYAGILVFQARDDTRALSLSGNAGLGLGRNNSGGVIYAPAALLYVSGNASLAGAVVVNQLSLSGNGASTQAVDSSDVTGDAAGQLLAGDVTVYVNDPAGLFTPDELARIQDAVNAVAAVVAPYGVTVSETSDPSAANVVIDTVSTSAVGGYADGILGCYTTTGEITLIQGWNWYAGADPAQIGVSQYDFETTVTHELGHALGLGESSDPTSAMSGTLAPGTAIRTLTTADLNIPYDEGGADGQRAAPVPAADEAVQHSSALESSPPNRPEAAAPFRPAGAMSLNPAPLAEVAGSAGDLSTRTPPMRPTADVPLVELPAMADLVVAPAPASATTVLCWGKRPPAAGQFDRERGGDASRGVTAAVAGLGAHVARDAFFRNLSWGGREPGRSADGDPVGVEEASWAFADALARCSGRDTGPAALDLAADGSFLAALLSTPWLVRDDERERRRRWLR
jgi:parallel beta-helix repeat protein